MILGDGWQMLMVTEEQDHEHLKNGKIYQKMSQNRAPKHANSTSIYIVSYGIPS